MPTEPTTDPGLLYFAVLRPEGPLITEIGGRAMASGTVISLHDSPAAALEALARHRAKHPDDPVCFAFVQGDVWLDARWSADVLPNLRLHVRCKECGTCEPYAVGETTPPCIAVGHLQELFPDDECPCVCTYVIPPMSAWVLLGDDAAPHGPLN